LINNDVITRFPELYDLDFPPGTVLHGELIVSNDEGKPDFEAINSRFMSRKGAQPISYVVFDVLQHRGKSTTNLPLLARKALLADLVPNHSALVSKAQFIEGYGEAYFDVVKEQAVEVIVLKRKDSRYEVGKRSHS
jgi:DNA ligase 1